MGERAKDATERNPEVARLLAAGLDAYGEGDVSGAILAWREVLRFDPGNREALDYIQAADRRKTPQLPAEEAPGAALLAEGRALLHRGELEAALDLLESAPEADSTNPEIHAYVDMLRSRLFKHYRSRVGELEAVPTLRVEPASVTRFNLPKDAGFVLSLLDGRTPLSDVITLSGMDAFQALRIVHGLLDAEIVGMRS